jgi:aminoglycoside phosphotransferase (APT) family kinase protein
VEPVERRFADELAWADAQVTRTGPPTARERPWSTVLTLPTADGPVWLKVTTPAARYEVGVYRILAERVPQHVLVPLARNDERGRLLLPDGGPTAFDGPSDGLAARVTAALATYADLQRAVAGHRAELLAAGVPDASPGALLDRYDQATALIADPGPGEDAERRRDRVADLARRLADAPGADLVTVDHQDLHPGNILVGPGETRFRFYDWGDAVVAQPFASLLVGLGALARTLGVRPDDPVILAARDAYLDRFADLAHHDELVATAVTACRAAVVARALTWHRAVHAAGADHPFAGTPRAVLAAVGDPADLSPFGVP